MKVDKLWLTYLGIGLMIVAIILNLLSLFNVIDLASWVSSLISALVIFNLYFLLFKGDKKYGKFFLIVGCLMIVFAIIEFII
ncbi:Uncharacterised protein [Staphylococcus piscifermentans]|uniref:Uncharacterized protein n=1 Tax=Staphylococcus piscifermentans TaxID=70258 RepID=A0A239TKJ5_9STAP|nr:hypothetical protein [Staphylococcus piscifermentans]RTX85719.1 hypothetical protein CD139_03225 [Staphylococcus piscifermentans]GEP84515.1 hypothetical protein SPI02_11000 [Staphylococcus piscifermentans]SNU97718.1 Uncharacterised protein [Staphylococcus piscifermentans]